MPRSRHHDHHRASTLGSSRKFAAPRPDCGAAFLRAVNSNRTAPDRLGQEACRRRSRAGSPGCERLHCDARRDTDRHSLPPDCQHVEDSISSIAWPGERAAPSPGKAEEAIMSVTPKPSYRADHVGSLLRPQSVKDARKRYQEDRTIRADEMRTVEDAAIRDVVKLQQDTGLMAVSDGEMRRSWWHYDFMGLLTGLDLEERDKGIAFAGVQLRPIYPAIGVFWIFRPIIRIFNTTAVSHRWRRSPPKSPFRDPVAAISGCRPKTSYRPNMRMPTGCSQTSRAPTRRRCTPFTTPAAAICRWTTSSLPICATRNSGDQEEPRTGPRPANRALCLDDA